MQPERRGQTCAFARGTRRSTGTTGSSFFTTSMIVTSAGPPRSLQCRCGKNGGYLDLAIPVGIRSRRSVNFKCGHRHIVSSWPVPINDCHCSSFGSCSKGGCWWPFLGGISDASDRSSEVVASPSPLRTRGICWLQGCRFLWHKKKAQHVLADIGSCQCLEEFPK